MILLAHVIVGAEIGNLISNPLISVPIAFGSHFLLDMLPHVQAPTDPGYIPNKKTYLIAGVDIVLALLLVLLLKENNLLNASVSLALTAAVFPDILDTTRYSKTQNKVLNYYYNFHDKIQKETSKSVGYLTQLAVILLGLFLLGVL